MGKRHGLQKPHAVAQLLGTDKPTSKDWDRAKEFWRETAPEDYVKSGKRRYSTKRKRGKTHPAAAKANVGVSWLRKFASYEGDGCLLFPFRTVANPRGNVTYNFRKMAAHRAMCFLTHRLPPDGKDLALHKCGNGHLGCVNPKHLYWGDKNDNAKDAHQHAKEGKPDANANYAVDVAAGEKQPDGSRTSAKRRGQRVRNSIR